MAKALRTEDVMRYKIKKGDRVALPYNHDLQGEVARRYRSGEVVVMWYKYMEEGRVLMHNPNYLDKRRYQEWVPGR